MAASMGLAFMLLSLWGWTAVPNQAWAGEPAAGHVGHGGVLPPAQPQAAPGPQASEQEAPAVEIPADKQELIGLKTAAVSVQPLQKVVRTVGRIEYDETRLATINTKFEAWIERLYVDYTGKYVKKGEPIAELYSPELFATEQEFINLLKWSKEGKETSSPLLAGMLTGDAATILDAARQRLRLWDISDAQIRKLEETGKPMRTLTLYSPVNGYVVQKAAIQGMRVMPGDKLVDIADLSTLWVLADIYEYELPLIKVGDAATIRLSSLPDKVISSKIDYIYPSISGDTRTVKVRFVIDNLEGRLKPQMFTDVEIHINLGKRLAIPEDAVMDTGIRQIVYVDKGNGFFEPREVTLGVRAQGMVEVLKGLTAGEKVASSANFLIDSEAKLKGVVQ
mgnify:CR=1 FL=1